MMFRKDRNIKSKGNINTFGNNTVTGSDEIMSPYTLYTYSLPNTVDNVQHNNSSNNTVENTTHRNFSRLKDEHQQTANSCNNANMNNWRRRGSLSTDEAIINISNRNISAANNAGGGPAGAICRNDMVDEHNLPEWATETPLSIGGGTFDATGEFHGLIHDDNTTIRKEGYCGNDLRTLFNKNDVHESYNMQQPERQANYLDPMTANKQRKCNDFLSY